MSMSFMKSDDGKFIICLFIFYPIKLPHSLIPFSAVFIDHLKTVSLRPTWMYGEEDTRFFPAIMRFADKWNGQIPRIAEGGKKQMSYVGKFFLLLFAGPLKSQI